MLADLQFGNSQKFITFVTSKWQVAVYNHAKAIISDNMQMASYELWFRQKSNAIIDSIFHRLVAQCSTLLQNVIAWFYSPHPVNVQTLLLHWIRRMHTKCAFSIDMFNKRFNEFLFPSNATEVHFRCQWPKQVACIRLAKLNALLCSVIYSYVCIVF